MRLLDLGFDVVRVLGSSFGGSKVAGFGVLEVQVSCAD